MTHVKYQTQAHTYDIETVKEAVGAALDLGHHELAQEIMDHAGYELCLLCFNALPMDTIELPDTTCIQACASCATEFQP